MNRTDSLSTRLIKIEAGLLIAALLAMGSALWMSQRLNGAAAALNEAGRMRMQTWRLASASQSGLPHIQMEALALEFEASLHLIAEGDASRPLRVPWDDETVRDFREVEQAWSKHKALLLQPAGTGSDVESATTAFLAVVDRFVSSIEHRMGFLSAVLGFFQLLMMVFSVIGAAVVFYAGYRYIIRPLVRLQKGLSQIELTQFSERLPVTSDDEFGRVSQSVNRMAGTLQSLYGDMEGQVAMKTRPLTVQKERFEALYNVSVLLDRAATLQEMCQGFSTHVRELMKADSIVVRWLGDSPDKYLIVGGDRFPMSGMEEERCLRVGVCACGSPVADSRTKIIPIRDSDVVPLQHCDRLGYRTLISVPVRVRNKTLGEINLFFRREMALPDEDRELVEALAHHLAWAAEGMRAAAQDREAAVAGERGRIARELHDSIAQSLAFLKIQVGLLRTAVARDDRPGIDHTLGELGHGINECTVDVRELLLHFRVRANGDDIDAAIEEILRKFRQQAGIEANWSIDGDALPLDQDVQIQVLHVIQEALSNIRKHARASRATLEVHRGSDWTFTVSDDGIGFDAGTDENFMKVGLKIMQERASAIGAVVTVTSQSNQGTIVHLKVPGTPVPDLGTDIDGGVLAA